MEVETRWQWVDQREAICICIESCLQDQDGLHNLFSESNAAVGMQAAMMVQMKAVQAAFETAADQPSVTAASDHVLSPTVSNVAAEAEGPASEAHECAMCKGDKPNAGPLGWVVNPQCTLNPGPDTLLQQHAVMLDLMAVPDGIHLSIWRSYMSWSFVISRSCYYVTLNPLRSCQTQIDCCLPDCTSL